MEREDHAMWWGLGTSVEGKQQNNEQSTEFLHFALFNKPTFIRFAKLGLQVGVAVICWVVFQFHLIQ